MADRSRKRTLNNRNTANVNPNAISLDYVSINQKFLFLNCHHRSDLQLDVYDDDDNNDDGDDELSTQRRLQLVLIPSGDEMCDVVSHFLLHKQLG